MEKRPWTVEEDRLLKYVFESSRLTKWSHIARKLQEDYGIKGRNGKQCKERYATIDPSFQKEEWSYDDEQLMLHYHNDIGNKWAVIGTKLGGRSDNCVKNHFYALLRKALRKINKVIHTQFRKEYKQFSPTILYRIVQVAEEKFKLFPNYEQNLCQFSQQLKIELVQFSYDDQIGGDDDIDVQAVREFIAKLTEFSGAYKRRPKKERRGSGGQDLLTPTRYHLDRQQSEGNNSFMLSSDTSNVDDISDDDLSRGETNSRHRKNSVGSAEENFVLPQAVRSRAKSQGNLNLRFSYSETPYFQMKQEEPYKEGKMDEEVCGDITGTLGEQGIMAGLSLLKEEECLPPDPIQLNKSVSSKYSRELMEAEDNRFYFEESGFQISILPEIDMDERNHEDHFF